MSDRSSEDVFYKVYIGNIDFEVSQKAVEDLVRKHGEVADVLLKTGYCFVTYRDKDCANRCIDALDDQCIFSARRLRAEMAKGSGTTRTREIQRRELAEPNRTLFVVNFQPETTHLDDLRRFFEQWGELDRVQLKTKFAFVQFERLEDARCAIDGTKEATFNGRKLTVEYCAPNVPAAGSREGGGGPPPRERERRPLDFPFAERAEPRRPFHDDYGPPPLRMREAYAAPYDREPPPRRLYEREPLYPAGHLQRDYGPPPPCSYYRRDPRDVYHDPRFEAAAYYERRRPPPMHFEAPERALRPHRDSWEAERPLRRMAEADERFDPCMKTGRARYASPGPERKLARFEARQSENCQDGPLRSPSPGKRPLRAASPHGRRASSGGSGGRENW